MNYTENDKISNHFTYREALWLPTWGRMASVGDGVNVAVLANLQRLFSLVDQVRDFFDAPINVHVAYRPAKYNQEISGAHNSAHLALDNCAAVDFDVTGVDCEAARQKLLGSGILERLGLRLEDNGSDAHWLHLDTRPVPAGGHRFFKP